MSNDALPDSLKNKKHSDYFWPFSLIPRGWTASKRWGVPRMMAGNQNIHRTYTMKDSNVQASAPSPIGEPGSWQISLYLWAEGWRRYVPYLAFTTKGGFHFRIGPRWDNVDGYVQFPSVAIKRGVKANGDN